MNPLAQALNQQLQAANPHVAEMMSDFGKEFYFPKGILSQSAEAKAKAKRYNATIGTASEGGVAMNLASVMSSIPGITPDEALLYAPPAGLPDLRAAWQAKNLVDNPGLAGVAMSLPVVTNGLTHGLGLVADLFVNPGDTVLLPDKQWDNYPLTFGLRRGAILRDFPFFAGEGFNQDGFAGELAKLAAEGKKKVVVLLNFPNNPTGYTPTEAEGEAIAASLLEAAEGGMNVVVLIDDAYFGLFYGPAPMRQSLFAKLAGKHPRLLAIKADAATKEVFVWGLRIGFLTYSVGGAAADSPLYQALVSKTMGCIRSMISNCSSLSQTVVLRALRNPAFPAERAAKVAVMEQRAFEVKRVLADGTFAEAWDVYPFNSGYFMCLRLRNHPAEEFCAHMLNEHGMEVIAANATDLRIAFSAEEKEDIPKVFDLLLQGAKELG